MFSRACIWLVNQCEVPSQKVSDYECFDSHKDFWDQKERLGPCLLLPWEAKWDCSFCLALGRKKYGRCSRFFG